MPIQHVNRKGDTYYLHQGKTKTGRTNWFFSMRAGDDLTESIPEGYEIYEKPNGQIFLRKIASKLVTPEEIATVEKAVRVQHCIVEAEKDAIVVYLPDQDAESVMRDLRQLLPFGRNFPASFKIEQYLHYSPVMRFVLREKQQRLFSVYRWCFRGSVDDWILLAAADELPKQVERFVPHLLALSASMKPSSVRGSRPWKPRATRPSPATASSRPSRTSCAASGPRTSACGRSATS